MATDTAVASPASLHVLQRLAGNRAVVAQVGARIVVQRAPGDPRTGRVVVDPFGGPLLVRVGNQRFELPAGHGFVEGQWIDFTEGAPNVAGGRPTVVGPVVTVAPAAVAAPIVAPPAQWNLAAGVGHAVVLTVAQVHAGVVAPIAPGHNHWLGDVTLTTYVGGVAVSVNVHRNAGANIQGGGYAVNGHWALGNAPNSLAQAIALHPGYAAAVAAAEARL